MGIERRATIREGDLSLSGLHVRLDAAVGEPGQIYALRLRSRDKAIRLEVPARVVRVERTDDLLSGTKVRAVAFEFLCYEPGKREELSALVLHMARESDAEPEADAEPDVGGLSLETGWQLRKGERVRIEVPSPSGGTMRFEGRAVRSRRKPSGAFRTQVEAMGEAPPLERPEPITGIRESLSGLDASALRARPQPVHLSGDLAYLSMPGVLSIVALERFTGELRVTRERDSARVYVRDGQVVDCVGGAGRAPLDELARLFNWREGRFELSIGACDRADRIETSTTALLLDLARELDEKKRVA